MANDPLKRLFLAAKQNRAFTLSKGEVRFLATLIQSASDQLNTARAIQAMTGGTKRKALRGVKKMEKRMLKEAQKEQAAREADEAKLRDLADSREN